MQNKKQLVIRIQKLKANFDNGLIPKLKKHEVNPGLDKADRLNYLYFTLPVSLNFQRSSPAMWQAALATFNDPQTNYLYHPELVIKQNREKLQIDLTKHKLALQKNKHVDIWFKLATTFATHYENHPKNFFLENDYDIERIIPALKTKRQYFPYLSGPKMANYWMLILHKYTDSKFKNLHKVSIIPDTHVRQATEKLALGKATLPAEEISRIWFELLQDSGINPIDMHSVLWNWSRNNFLPEV